MSASTTYREAANKLKSIECLYDFSVKISGGSMGQNTFHRKVKDNLMVDPRSLQMLDCIEIDKEIAVDESHGTPWHMLLEEFDTIQRNFYGEDLKVRPNDSAIMLDQLLSGVGLDFTECPNYGTRKR
jgi:hypothetical protein